MTARHSEMKIDTLLLLPGQGLHVVFCIPWRTELFLSLGPGSTCLAFFRWKRTAVKTTMLSLTMTSFVQWTGKRYEEEFTSCYPDEPRVRGRGYSQRKSSRSSSNSCMISNRSQVTLCIHALAIPCVRWQLWIGIWIDKLPGHLLGHARTRIRSY